MLLQLLPHLLASRAATAVTVFLDFRKAFDTVSRPFLLEVLAALGAGDGFCAWVQLLLGDTSAFAVLC